MQVCTVVEGDLARSRSVREVVLLEGQLNSGVRGVAQGILRRGDTRCVRRLIFSTTFGALFLRREIEKRRESVLLLRVLFVEWDSLGRCVLLGRVGLGSRSAYGRVAPVLRSHFPLVVFELLVFVFHRQIS